jgi:hypothetical protein
VETNKDVENMRRRHARLAEKLSRTGLIAQGTITERIIEREDKSEPGGIRRFGPYYQWTFKNKGKTVTVNLSKEQVKHYEHAIENHRRMEVIVTQMRELSLCILEHTTKGVIKRKPKQ